MSAKIDKHMLEELKETIKQRRPDEPVDLTNVNNFLHVTGC